MAKKDLQGTLDLLVLKTLAQRGEMHGYGIVLHLQKASDELLAVEEGSLYPALHRMEQGGWIKSNWALTESGRKELEAAEKNFDQLVKGVRAVMRYA
jgi:DNA-binding PadR family transcriptional regulator